jgi:hypothetical protein
MTNEHDNGTEKPSPQPSEEDLAFFADLLDYPTSITQADLCELQRLERAFEIARDDFRAVHDQILEMLTFGYHGDGGPLVARLERGRVVVEDMTPEGPGA